MLYTIAAGLARSFDAWLVARHFDDQVFAIFRYGAREFPLVLALAGGMSTAMISKLLIPSGVSELKERTTRLMHICYPIIAVCMLASVPLFVFVFGEAFREGAWIFNVYLLLTLFQLVFPQTIMTARGDTRWLWYIAMIELAVNIVASLVLLHHVGLIGIAFGTLIAFLVEKVLMLSFVQWKYGLRVGEVVSFKTWITYAVILVIAYFMALWIFGH
jgi:O-antigen/teichoic acid export membrane protein